MKIKFTELDYQEEAIQSIVQVFEGQEIRQSTFTITNNDQQGKLFMDSGVGNRLTIPAAKMLENTQRIQIQNQVPLSDTLSTPFPQFNIEMETGTGKTFVYLKSIIELNHHYGFTKFVIVVPSVAIREGVMKTYEMTKELFRPLIHDKSYRVFQYDSNRLNEVQQFAQSDGIEVMIMNIQAFNSKTEGRNGAKNIIYRDDIETMQGYRPMDLIAQTNPIVIIDEPQSVDNTTNAQEAIEELNPLASFRYSATHKNKTYPLLYRLGPVEAYEKELVKRIEVAGVRANSYGNDAHLRLLEVKVLKSGLTAVVEMYVKKKGYVVKERVNLKQGDDVYLKSKKVAAYDQVGFVQDISAIEGEEYIQFSGEPHILTLASSTEMDLLLKRGQISKTIEEHLDRELKLNPKGIKVLSLFFIDQVDRYRQYDEDNMPIHGIYAEMFEEEYRALIQRPKYQTLRDAHVSVEEVHDGYFATDSKSRFKNTGGESKDDETTYEIIMKDKEDLLTFYDEERGQTKRANKLRFIFSHSALKEGWDNPNVFQICTLLDTKNEFRKRQQIGRGLRIAVNQDGERVPGFEVNTLTVMASESYEQFAEDLQREYEEDGATFGAFQLDIFSSIIIDIDEETGDPTPLGNEVSKQIVEYLKEEKFLDKKLKGTAKLAQAIKTKTFRIPEEVVSLDDSVQLKLFDAIQTQFDADRVEIKNRDERVKIQVKKAALAEPFVELWNRIKYKTRYVIEFNTESFIEAACERLKSNLNIPKETLEYKKATLTSSYAGIHAVNEQMTFFDTVEDTRKIAPDILSYLQNETDLTRHTLIRILKESETLLDFKRNPQMYMMEVAEILNQTKRFMMVDGIKYEKLGDNEYYDQKLFLEDELTSYKENVIESLSERTVYDHIVFDSDVEREFAEQCEQDNDIKFYIKLPAWFKIKTPLGPYNPDWAILKEDNNEERLYFIVETKGSSYDFDLRPSELGKIQCGTKHFEAVDSQITFKTVRKYQEV